MWRWTLVCLVVLHGYTLSQPVTDDSKNDRTLRQLDFKECCPCDVQAFDADSQDTLAAGTEGMLASSRAVDDCPCRLRDADAQGSASVFFPTAMRAAGAFLRPDDKKEDLKPIFNPEVGLASSVLETLREVTDEEYREALARDAAKSAVRAVEDIEFGDAIPQESGNIFTIVVNPNGDPDDGVIQPQASHVHTSRCIHPISSARTSLARMRMAPKPSSVLHKPKLPMLQPKLLHRHFYDMDNGVGASNVHEHIVPIEGEIKDLKAYSSPLKTSAGMKTIIPDFHSDSVQNKLRDFELTRSSLLQNLRDKSSYLSRVPKLRLNNLLSGKAREINEDLSPATSTVNEKVQKKFPSLRTNSPLGSIIQNGRPLSLSNILNLRDVELVPFKEVTPKKDIFKLLKPKLELPSLFEYTDRPSEKEIQGTETSENTKLIINVNAVDDNNGDTEGSPSLVNIQVSQLTEPNSDDDCDNGMIENHNIDAKFPSTEILEKLPGSKNEQSNIVSNEDFDCLDHSDDQDLITNSNNNINQFVEPTVVQQPQNNNTLEEQRNIKSNEDIDCLSQSDDQALVTDSNNNSNKIIKTQHVTQLLESNETIEGINAETNVPSDLSDKSFESESSSPGLNSDHLSIDKTLSTIKENIAKKIEDLKNKTSVKHIFNRISFDDKIKTNGEPIIKHNNQDEDCQNEASNQIRTIETTISTKSLNDIVTTSVEPDLSEDISENDATTSKPDTIDNAKYASECSGKAVSMDDLQSISDSMLEQEEQIRKSKKSQCPNEELQVLPENEQNAEDLHSNESASTPEEIVVDSENANAIEPQNNMENACESDVSILKKKNSSQSDTSAEASNLIIKSVRPSNNIISSQQIIQPLQDPLNMLNKPLPKLSDVIKLAHFDNLSSLNHEKFKLTTLFKSNSETDNAQERSTLDTEPKSEMQQVINPVMETDASTNNFQLRKPPSTLLENANFDIFGFKRPTSFLESIPKLELPFQKTTFPLNLSSKPFKLQSALEDKGSFLNINHPNIASSIFKIPRLDFMREQLQDSPLESTKNIHSSIKKSQKALESKLRLATDKNFNVFKSPIKSSPSLLETISRNHEDISDKLKALHMDFNDRIETMHNELSDRTKLLTSGSFIEKPSTKLFSTSRKEHKSKPLKHTWQATSRKESTKPLKLRKPVEEKLAKIPPRSKVTEQKIFKMPAAASIPVPRTVQVPELKPTSVKIPPLTLQRSYFNLDANPAKELLRPLERQAGTLQSTNKLFEKPSNLKKLNNIKVSFSTTPRPVLSTTTGISRGKFGTRLVYGDPKVSPSEITQTKIAVHTSGQLFKEKHSRIDNGLQTRKSASAADNLKQLTKQEHSKSIGLRSWPSASESDFLSKVKEAVQTRLSKMNMPLSLKQPSHLVNIEEEPSEIHDLNVDMAREASENKEVIDTPALKENVSYKCKMVCTTE